MVTCLLRPDDWCENEPCRDDCELKYPPPTAPKLRWGLSIAVDRMNESCLNEGVAR